MHHGIIAGIQRSALFTISTFTHIPKIAFSQVTYAFQQQEK